MSPSGATTMPFVLFALSLKWFAVHGQLRALSLGAEVHDAVSEGTLQVFMYTLSRGEPGQSRIEGARPGCYFVAEVQAHTCMVLRL